MNLRVLTEEVVAGDKRRVEELVREALEGDTSPKEAFKALIRGIEEIGEKWTKLEVFIPDVMKASDAMKAGMALVAPRLKEGDWVSQGTVVVGTVKGDIHDIGKNIVGTMLGCSGFDVHDIGVDKAAATFLEKAREVKADIIAVSALLTTTMSGQKDMIDLLINARERERYLVMVGGGPVSREWADSIGADGYGETAADAVQLAKELIARKREVSS